MSLAIASHINSTGSNLELVNSMLAFPSGNTDLEVSKAAVGIRLLEGMYGTPTLGSIYDDPSVSKLAQDRKQIDLKDCNIEELRQVAALVKHVWNTIYSTHKAEADEDTRRNLIEATRAAHMVSSHLNRYSDSISPEAQSRIRSDLEELLEPLHEFQDYITQHIEGDIKARKQFIKKMKRRGHRARI